MAVLFGNNITKGDSTAVSELPREVTKLMPAVAVRKRIAVFKKFIATE